VYGKYNEVLPEEIMDNANLGIELRTQCTLLGEIISEDTSFIERILGKARLRSPLPKLSSPEMIIKWALESDDNTRRKSELIKQGLAQWMICKDTLPLLSDKIIDELSLVVNTYTDYRRYPLTSREKRIAFISFTRHYQNFIGYSGSIRDIIDEYYDTFNMVCKQIDQNYQIDYTTQRSAIFASHIKQGFVELLLRGYQGRYAPFPLMRSYIEVRIVRTLLNTKYSNKFRGRNIIVLKSFKSADIWDIMRTANAGSELQTYATSLLYDWGSMSVHRGIRTLYSLMWYSLIFTDTLDSLLAGAQLTPEQLDNIIDKLVADKKVIVA
jgi:hypothetical protein